MNNQEMNDATKPQLRAFLLQEYTEYLDRMKIRELRQEARPFAEEEKS